MDRRERLWRGTVEPGGLRISCSRLRDGWWGRVVGEDGQSWMLEPWGDRTAVYNSSDALACGGTCGVIDGVFNDSRDPVITRMGGPGGGGGLQVCGLAAEADWAFFQTWGADALGRVESVLDAMNLQYESGQITQLILFLVRTRPTILAASPILQVCSHRARWNTNQQLIERDVAHLFTGKERWQRDRQCVLKCLPPMHWLESGIWEFQLSYRPDCMNLATTGPPTIVMWQPAVR